MSAKDLSALFNFANKKLKRPAKQGCCTPAGDYLPGDLEIEYETWIRLRAVLDGLLANGHTEDSPDLNYFREFESSAKLERVITGGTTKRVISPSIRLGHLQLNGKLTKIADQLFAILENPELIQKIKSCQKCFQYFLAAKVDKRIRYCRDCSKKNKMTADQRRLYQQRYRAAIKAEKAALEKKDYIKRLTEAGWPEAEAEEMYRADREADK